MIEHYRKARHYRATGEDMESGFTLIELLIVIVVLGILAAVVIFSLGGVTSQSAVAACNSDAKSVEVAVEAYHDFPANTANLYPTQMSDLTNGIGAGTQASGPFLRTLPNNTAYAITIVGSKGEVDVTPTGGTQVNYDLQTTANGCNAVT
jgi:prepilin-type N-terminal cleavage/methylation domain-containing protein